MAVLLAVDEVPLQDDENYEQQVVQVCKHFRRSPKVHSKADVFTSVFDEVN